MVEPSRWAHGGHNAQNLLKACSPIVCFLWTLSVARKAASHQQIPVSLQVQLCTHFLQNKCKRGKWCTFAHTLMDLRGPPPGWSTAKTDMPDPCIWKALLLPALPFFDQTYGLVQSK
jgi:hypothetical protein